MAVSFLTETAEAAPPRAPVPAAVVSSSDEVAPPNEEARLETLPLCLEWASSLSALQRLVAPAEQDFVSLNDEGAASPNSVLCWTSIEKESPATSDSIPTDMESSASSSKGIDGYPFEIQSLFYFALRCARQLLKPVKEDRELLERIDKRITALSFHIQKYYRPDFTELNNIYRHKTELYSRTALNNFNVIPESIPGWVFDIVPLQGGYMIGNVTAAQIDFGWFLVAILTSLARPAQATTIMDLIEEHWENLIGEMPLKIPYPALEGHKWRIVTGFDLENTRWSYHNDDSWPTLLWLLTAVCIKSGGPQMAMKAIELVEQRASTDGWPKSYDGTTGKYIRKQDREHQTSSISDYPVEEGNEYPTNMIQLFVRSLSGALLALEVDVCILIKTLKVLIQHKEGIKLEEQILCYGGKILRDDKRIAEYYIRKESTIDMLLPLPGGMDAMDKGFFRLIVEGSVPQILEENGGLYSLAKQQLVKSVNRSVGEDADLNDKNGFLSRLYDDLLINLYPIPQPPIPGCPHAQIARKIISIKSPWDLARTRLQQVVCDNISWYQMTWDATINTIDIDKMVNPLFEKLVLQRLQRDVIEYLAVGNRTTLDSVISAMEGKYRMNLENQRGFIRNVVGSIGTRNMKRLRSS